MKTREPIRECGCCAGIVIMNDTEIQRCDDCKIFRTDEAAANAAWNVLKIFAEHRLNGHSAKGALNRMAR
jgi:hypothetical protein